MKASKAAACGLVGLALAGLGSGCLDYDGGRPHTLPKQTGRPTARRPAGTPAMSPAALASGRPLPTQPTAAPMPAPTGNPASVNPLVPDLPLTPMVASGPPDPPPPEPTPAEAPSSIEKVVSRSSGPVLNPTLTPPTTPTDPPALPTAPQVAVLTRVPALPDDPSQPPPIPSVVRPSPSGDGNAFSNDDGMEQLRLLHRRAVEQYATMDSYIARLSRREQVNGKDRPEETLLFKFRKQPFSVYFKWLGIQGRDREVVYVKGQYGDQLHTLLADGDVPFMSAGKRMAFAVDSVLVRSNSRHSITDAGIGNLIDKFGFMVEALERGDRKCGSVKYLGKLRRPEFDKPLEAVEQVVPPGVEPQLSRGGSRLWMFETDSRLPLLLITTDHNNHEVEYYCYDRLQSPMKLDDDDFNPDRLWKKK